MPNKVLENVEEKWDDITLKDDLNYKFKENMLITPIQHLDSLRYAVCVGGKFI